MFLAPDVCLSDSICKKGNWEFVDFCHEWPFLQHFGIYRIFPSSMTWQVKTTNPEEIKLWRRLPLYAFYNLSILGVFYHLFFFFCTLAKASNCRKSACMRSQELRGRWPPPIQSKEGWNQVSEAEKSPSKSLQRKHRELKRNTKESPKLCCLFVSKCHPRGGLLACRVPSPPSREGSYQPLQGPAGLRD